ncbi:hypothetical protein SVAN01_06708 [Stagonosporopsis vannaccii]|nr:hypothetical protein SVAN01_06708 [Stagonosporopsis vannaccii]
MTQIVSASAALLGTAFAAPAKGGTVQKTNKPATGGPASASVTVYPSYTCTDPNSPPPSDGSVAGAKTSTVTEGQCIIASIPLDGAITASLTAPPKAGAPGCYIQLFKDQGCGVTLSNQYHGFPFNGVAVGNSVGCVAPPVQAYGAYTINCG